MGAKLTSVTDKQRQRTEDRHCSKGDDEWSHATFGNGEAIRCSCGSPHYNSPEEDSDNCSSTSSQVVQEQDPNSTHQGKHRANGEVDPSRYDDEGHPQPDDPRV